MDSLDLQSVRSNDFSSPALVGIIVGMYGYVGSILTLIDNGGNVLAGLPLMAGKQPDHRAENDCTTL